MKNVSIRVKILSLVVAIVSLFLVFVFVWVIPNIKDGLYAERLLALKAPVEMVYTYLDSMQTKVIANEISKEEAINEILQTVASLKYEGGKNYVWINDNEDVMLCHPNSKLINTDMSDRADKNGVRFINEMTKVTTTNGEGYVEYHFPKPNNLDLHLLKISYGKYHQYWKYVVATGVWVDDVEVEIAEIRNKVLIGVFIGIIISMLIAYFISKTIINPIIQARNKLINMSEGIF